MKNSSKFVLTLLGAILSQNIFANEDSTSSHFSKLLEQKNNAELTQFLNQMPKGGDLHHHFSGSLYFEDYLNFIEESKVVGNSFYCLLSDKDVITKNNKFLKNSIVDMNLVNSSSPNYILNEKNCISIKNLKLDQNKELYTHALNKWSQLDYFNQYHEQDTSYNHFFNTFLYFSDFSKKYTENGIIKIVERAKSENVSYIETMLEGSPYIDSKKVENTEILKLIELLDFSYKNGDIEKSKEHLKDIITLIEKDNSLNEKILEQSEKLNNLAKIINQTDVKVKFQTYATRNKAPIEVLSGIVSAYKLASINHNVVGVNFVSAEHSPYSMNNYMLHMETFKILNAKYPNVKLALHAGELKLGLVEPEKLTSNIKNALDAGAQRIGHGVSIGYEDPSVLQELKAKDIAVEINLTSNEVILGVKDEHHPIKLYQEAKVPFVISTDDSGVSRNNLTNEYFKFSTRYKPDYRTLKNTVYASINYSFLNDVEKNQLKLDLDDKFTKFENKF